MLIYVQYNEQKYYDDIIYTVCCTNENKFINAIKLVFISTYTSGGMERKVFYKKYIDNIMNMCYA